jgi:hypothetical protein
VDPRAGLDVVERGKVFVLVGLELRPLYRRPRINYALAAPITDTDTDIEQLRALRVQSEEDKSQAAVKLTEAMNLQ